MKINRIDLLDTEYAALMEAGINPELRRIELIIYKIRTQNFNSTEDLVKAIKQELQVKQLNYFAADDFCKYGINFADAVSVFSDNLAITIPEEEVNQEQFVTIGTDAFGKILVVVYTLQGDEIRLISARKATRQEEQQYKI